MRIPLLMAVTALLLCSACGGRTVVSVPGDTLYTVSCDNDPNDCRVGAQTLCAGPYELVSNSGGEGKKRVGNFGWVDTDGEQSDVGSGGGRYSIRIRCVQRP